MLEFPIIKIRQPTTSYTHNLLVSGNILQKHHHYVFSRIVMTKEPVHEPDEWRILDRMLFL